MALNSAQKTKSLSIAIAFGMIVGLTPTANIHNLILLAIVFYLNIHFGFFFLSMALFSIVGFAFDPLFHKLGLFILTQPSFESAFTTFYNMPFARLTNFNNTVVMGSLVSSLALFVPTYFTFNILIKAYREKVALKLSKFKYAKWFGFYNEDKKEKKQSPVRWWGLGVFAIISVLIASFFILLFDFILKFILTTTLSIVSNRDVVIDSLHTDMLDARLNIRNVYFINNDEPNINDVEVGSVDVDIDLEKLFYKKTVIELVNIGGIKFATASKVHREKKEKSEDNNFMSKVAVPSAEFILSKNKLDVLTTGDNIKKNSRELKEQFAEAKKSYESKEYEKILAESKALLEKIKTTKSLSKIASLKKDYDKLETKTKKFKDKYQKMAKDLYNKQNQLTKDTLSLDSVAKGDYKNLLSKYALNTGGAINTIGDLAGGKYEGYLRDAWGYYLQLQPYLDDGEPKEPVQKRKRGYNVRFADFSPAPDFWLKKATLDAVYKVNNFNGLITDVSTDHNLVGRPAILNIDGKSKLFKSFNIRGINDGRVTPALTTLDMNAKGYILAKQDFDNMMLEESKVNMSTNLRVVGDRVLLQSKADFLESKITTTINEDFVKNILASIKSFDVQASGYISNKESKINASTNLDKKISDGFKKELSKELKKLEVELQAKINKVLQEKLQDINVDQKEIDKIKNFVDNKELDVSSIQDTIKKELEKRAKKIAQDEVDKGKKKLEDRAKKELQKMFKF
jgi:uncharacterized protein (TIGR03545 family)/uncharacterized protein (TIGR03546 family)